MILSWFKRIYRLVSSKHRITDRAISVWHETSYEKIRDLYARLVSVPYSKQPKGLSRIHYDRLRALLQEWLSSKAVINETDRELIDNDPRICRVLANLSMIESPEIKNHYLDSHLTFTWLFRVLKNSDVSNTSSLEEACAFVIAREYSPLQFDSTVFNQDVSYSGILSECVTRSDAPKALWACVNRLYNTAYIKTQNGCFLTTQAHLNAIGCLIISRCRMHDLLETPAFAGIDEDIIDLITHFTLGVPHVLTTKKAPQEPKRLGPALFPEECR